MAFDKQDTIMIYDIGDWPILSELGIPGKLLVQFL
jgi:hypothetical protein